jgi:hypothetical protein
MFTKIKKMLPNLGALLAFVNFLSTPIILLRKKFLAIIASLSRLNNGKLLIFVIPLNYKCSIIE